jgi:hypothetical protein
MMAGKLSSSLVNKLEKEKINTNYDIVLNQSTADVISMHNNMLSILSRTEMLRYTQTVIIST